MTSIQIGSEIYDTPSASEQLSAEYIHRVWVKTGKPDRLEGEVAWKVMDAIMQVYGALYPREIEHFKKTIREDQSVERTPHEANKAGGGFIPISYPTRLLQLIKVYFKMDRLQDRYLIKNFIKRYPALKVTRYNLGT